MPSPHNSPPAGPANIADFPLGSEGERRGCRPQVGDKSGLTALAERRGY